MIGPYKFYKSTNLYLCYLNNKFRDIKTQVYCALVWISESYCFLSGPLISSRDVDLLVYETKGRQTVWEKNVFAICLRESGF